MGSDDQGLAEMTHTKTGANSSTAGFLFVVYVAGCLALLILATGLYKTQVSAYPSEFSEPRQTILDEHYPDNVPQDEIKLEPLSRQYHQQATRLNEKFLAEL